MLLICETKTKQPRKGKEKQKKFSILLVLKKHIKNYNLYVDQYVSEVEKVLPIKPKKKADVISQIEMAKVILCLTTQPLSIKI